MASLRRSRGRACAMPPPLVLDRCLVGELAGLGQLLQQLALAAVSLVGTVTSTMHVEVAADSGPSQVRHALAAEPDLRARAGCRLGPRASPRRRASGSGLRAPEGGLRHRDRRARSRARCLALELRVRQRRASRRTGCPAVPPRGPASPSPERRIWWPSSMPAGIGHPQRPAALRAALAAARRRRRFSTIWPLPRQRPQVVTLTIWPSIVERTWRTSPRAAALRDRSTGWSRRRARCRSQVLAAVAAP